MVVEKMQDERNMSNEKIRPCPSCESNKIERYMFNDLIYGLCMDCRLAGPHEDGWSLDKWNAMPRQEDFCEDLRRLIDRFQEYDRQKVFPDWASAAKACDGVLTKYEYRPQDKNERTT